MDVLPREIVFIFCSMLASNRSVLRFLSCTKNLHVLKHLVSFSCFVSYRKIKDLPYKHSFKKIEVHGSCEKLCECSPEHIKFSLFSDMCIKPFTLPHSIKYLEFSQTFDGYLYKGFFPPNLKHLVFGYKFDREIGLEILPSSLESINFGVNFNQPLQVGVLPPLRKGITFSYLYDQELHPGVIPNSVTHIM